MDIPKYAKLENERRFLVLHPPDLLRAPVRVIEDLYVHGSRMRLRAITRPDGGLAEFKFCKKYGSDDPVSGPIVNMYLSAEEHALLAVLPGRRLRKRRYTVAHGGRNFSVDVFEGPLQGLVQCETEAESPEAVRAVVFPPWAAREVTDDAFFTGANLAGVTAVELKARLTDVNLL